MKTIFTIIGVAVVAIIIALLVGGGTADAPTDTATSTPDQPELSAEPADGTYTVDSADSSVRWTARKSFISGYEDTGVIPVSAGSVTVVDGAVTTADITFDMDDIQANQTSNTSAGIDRLTSHLKSDDFLAVDQYATGTLAVSSVAPITGTERTTDYTVTADLTLKGETHEISFPAEIGTRDDSLVVRGTTTIDRSRWDIRFGSPSFFNDLGDSTIADAVDVSFELVAETAN